MMISETCGALTWAHMGDLHITTEHEANYRDFQSIIDSMNTHLVGRVDFCVLPGDNADDGSADQYDLIRRALERLKIPVHVIPGDHDRKPGHLEAFYQGLRLAPLPNAATVAGCHCLFLDVVSQGGGGPDFALGKEQLEWLKSQLQSASRLNHGVVSWRFKTLRSLWPFVMITSPADHRLVTDIARPGHVAAGQLRVTARVFGASLVHDCRCRINEGPWLELHPHGVEWQGLFEAPPQQFSLIVEAADVAGTTATDKILVATPGFRPPQRIADGSDADALSAWPERHLLGSRLGPNRNGRQW